MGLSTLATAAANGGMSAATALIASAAPTE
jgi:hypothetical protein